MTKSTHSLTIICTSGAAVQAAVLEGAELLATITRLADVLFVAAGTVCYGARYTCCSSGVGLLVTITGRALELSINC